MGRWVCYMTVRMQRVDCLKRESAEKYVIYGEKGEIKCLDCKDVEM